MIDVILINCIVAIVTVKLPELFDIIFKRNEREFDRFRWPLLEWVVDLDEGTVKKIRDRKNNQRFAAVIITLMYLVQVYANPFLTRHLH